MCTKYKKIILSGSLDMALEENDPKSITHNYKDTTRLIKYLKLPRSSLFTVNLFPFFTK